MSELLDHKDSTVRYKTAAKMLEFVMPPKESGNKVNVDVSSGGGRQKLLDRLRTDPDVQDAILHYSENGHSGTDNDDA